MIGLLLPAAAATLIGVASGGSLPALARVRVAWWPALLGAFLVELFLYNPPINQQGWAALFGPWMWVGTKLVMLAVLARNANIDRSARLGWVLAALGVGLNTVAIAANHGHMPQSPEAAAAVWGAGHVRPDTYTGRLENVSWMGPDTLFPWLCDILPLPRWLPRANVLSVGDVLLALGVGVWIFRVLRRGIARPDEVERESTSSTISPWAPYVVWGTIAAGLLVLAASVADVIAAAAWPDLLPFLVLAGVGQWVSVETFNAQRERITMTFAVVAVMAAVAALPHGAPLIAVAIAVTFTLVERQRRPDKILFNLADYALAGYVGRLTYVALGSPSEHIGLDSLVATLAAVTAFHVVNQGLVAWVVSLHAARPLPAVLKSAAWYTPNKLALGLIGGCVALVHEQLGPVGTLLFVLPLGVLRYTLTMYTRQTRRTIAALEHQARHDVVTGLPNRLLLRERLEAALAAGRGQPNWSGGLLLLLDLDRFKEVNDTFGHHAGDRLLEQIGERLGGSLATTGVVARLGGDEFAVLLPDTAQSDAASVAGSVLGLFDRPLVVENQRLQVGASIGIVHFPTDADDTDSLLRRADIAMYVAKRSRSGYAHFDSTLDEHSPERLALVGDLREAIERDALTLVYQPQVEADSGRVVGVEALVRWIHPRRGFIAPNEFIALAEHTGLIEPLTRCVLRQALRQCRVWLDRGEDLTVSVNVSAHDLHASFPGLVADLLAWHAVPSRLLRVELTEGAMMTDPERAHAVLRQLRDLGVRISVDDYGTGYSSLAYLGRLPIDELKIDRAFILDLLTSEANAAIVRSTIGLGHDLGLAVVAEGVEDQATWDVLAEFGCDVIQGYFASRPLPAADLERWLAERAAPQAVARAA
jgi:diguanylate cyclase